MGGDTATGWKQTFFQILLQKSVVKYSNHLKFLGVYRGKPITIFEQRNFSHFQWWNNKCQLAMKSLRKRKHIEFGHT